MIIKLPHVEPINTLNLPEDFEERVKNSFREFTEETREEYRYEDKLMYLDNLRKHYLGRYGADRIVKDLIFSKVEWEIDEYGDFPDKDDFWDFGFFEECVKAGQVGYRDNYEKRHQENERTMKVILDIIKIVVNY